MHCASERSESVGGGLPVPAGRLALLSSPAYWRTPARSRLSTLLPADKSQRPVDESTAKTARKQQRTNERTNKSSIRGTASTISRVWSVEWHCGTATLTKIHPSHTPTQPSEHQSPVRPDRLKQIHSLHASVHCSALHCHHHRHPNTSTPPPLTSNIANNSCFATPNRSESHESTTNIIASVFG